MTSEAPRDDALINKNFYTQGGGRKRKTSVPKRYVPTQLSKKDRAKQAKELKKSRKAYKKGKYHTRKKMKSFKSKVSPHIIKARKMYKIDKIKPTRKLAKATKCKLKGLKKMFQKGQGAYFSSGSRPNQTGHSWGYARMASAITGGKASAVDFKIIQENCSKKSRAYKLAKKAYKKYKKGTRRVKQVKIGGKKKTKKRNKKGRGKLKRSATTRAGLANLGKAPLVVKPKRVVKIIDDSLQGIHKPVHQQLKPKEKPLVTIGEITRALDNMQTGGKWSKKYKDSINCNTPRGFSQRQFCIKRKKRKIKTKKRKNKHLGEKNTQ